jgi:hypothetical protein
MWNRIKSFWRRNKARYAESVSRYGLPVILTAMLLRVVMAAGVVLLYKLGVEFQALSTTDAGLFVAAWALVWPLGPVRWVLAAVIAPPVVRRWRVWRGLPAELPPAEPEGPTDPEPPGPSEPPQRA